MRQYDNRPPHRTSSKQRTDHVPVTGSRYGAVCVQLGAGAMEAAIQGVEVGQHAAQTYAAISAQATERHQARAVAVDA